MAVVTHSHGVFTREEARRCGFSESQIDRRLGKGEWIQMYRGVYRLAVVPPSWMQEIHAAARWLGPAGLISHRAAAELWGMDAVPGGHVEVSTDGKRSRSPRPNLILHRQPPFPRCDLAVRYGLALTNPTRTLIDLAAVVDEEVLETALDGCIRRRLTSLPRLRWRLGLEDLRIGHGLRPLRFMVKERTDGAAIMDSRLETRFNRLVVMGGLPRPVRQMEFYERGVYLGWVDFAFPDAKVAIETDSWKWHFGRLAWEKDKRKANYLQRNGWRVVYVTWRQICDDPGYVLDLVRDLLKPTLL